MMCPEVDHPGQCRYLREDHLEIAAALWWKNRLSGRPGPVASRNRAVRRSNQLPPPPLSAGGRPVTPAPLCSIDPGPGSYPRVALVEKWPYLRLVVLLPELLARVPGVVLFLVREAGVLVPVLGVQVGFPPRQVMKRSPAVRVL